MAETDKEKAIALAVADLEKQFGKNCIMQMGKRNALKIEVIPTGVLSFDAALGVGGFARGRVVEVFGPESGGKTTVALQVIAQAQAAGGTAAFVDAEHALDPLYAANLGVKVPELWISQPDNGEQALEIVERLVKSGAYDVIVIDSVAALVPQAELDGEMGDAQMGLQARLMSQAMRKLVGAASKTKTCLLFINQIRMKIGVVFGNPETTTGGRALKFYSSQRVEVRPGAVVKEGEVAVGRTTKIKVVKNKVAAPFRECEVLLTFGSGFSQVADLINLGVLHGIVEKSGAWYAYKGERIGQGIANAIATVTANPQQAQAMFSEVRAKVLPEGE